MKLPLHYLLWILVLAQSCTNQKPADLRNSTTPRHAVKLSCSSMVLEGQVLSKKNILNVFDCSGWAKQYPDLNFAIKNSNEKSINHVFKIINDTFFRTKAKRKVFFKLIASAEARGEMKTIATLLEKSLAEHKVMTRVSEIFNTHKLDEAEWSNLMNVISDSNPENVKIVRVFKNLTTFYEHNKATINNLFSNEDKDQLIYKVEALLGDLSQNMDDKSWNYLSKTIYDADSPIQTWANDGVDSDLNILLDVIEQPEFYTDVTFVKDSLNTGIRCANRSSTKDFNINVGQELKHMIEGLKNENKESFEKLLLHGLSKYFAFEEFCEEKDQQPGIRSFYNVLKYSFNVLPSQHDFIFLKRLHQIFDDDRFVFFSFLSSESFSSLRNLLIDFKVDNRDEKLVRSLFEIMSKMSNEDLIALSELVHENTLNNSQTKAWYRSWSKLWKSLSTKEKNEIINFFGVFFEDSVNTSDALSFLESILISFPSFSPALAGNLTDEAFQTDIRYIVDLLGQADVQDQLSMFLSNKGLFEFIEILTQGYVLPTPVRKVSDEDRTRSITYVDNSQTIATVQSRACFTSLTEKYELDTSYYNLVNYLPESCLNILGQVGFVGQIYLWMNSSETYFRSNYQVDDFHSATGVWSPGMLQFIFSSAVKADYALESKDGKSGIKENLDEIHRVLTDNRLLETFHQFSAVYTSIDHKLNFDSRLLKFIDSKDDFEINQFTADSIRLLRNAEPYGSLVIRDSSCHEILASLGVNPCLSQDLLSDGVLQIFRVLKRKNERDKSLIKELLAWVHPSSGIELPFRKPKNRIHQTSIDEMIRFIYDLSSEKTLKTFTYTDSTNKESAVQGTILDRLEVVIRDISFSNNYYGAYFQNTIASADDYRNEVIESEKLLKIFDRMGGLLRELQTLPDYSKHRLKNIRKTYGSLVELSDNYIQSDGSRRNYGPFIQSLLTAIGTSSKVSTQRINPYKTPSDRLVEGHNGLVLTQFVELSGLRHLSRFVRARFDSKLSALNTDSFKKINANLFGRHDLEKIQIAFQSVLDKYLDNDKNQINLFIEDVIHFIANLDSADQKVLEEIALKSLVLMSDERYSTANIEKIAKFLDLSIEMWPEIRKVLSGIREKKKLLNFINELFDSFVRNREELNRISDILFSSSLVNIQDLRDLLCDKIIMTKLIGFVDQLMSLHGFQTTLNRRETFEAMFSSSDTQWESLKTWLNVGLGENKNKVTISLLISLLGEKNSEGYRLKGIVDEFFSNHRPELEQFLTETFKSLELRSN